MKERCLALQIYLEGMVQRFTISDAWRAIHGWEISCKIGNLPTRLKCLERNDCG